MLVDERRETVGVLRLIGLPDRPHPGPGAARRAAGGGRRVRLRARCWPLASESADQPLLPVALRHGAGLRPRHAGGGAARAWRSPCRSASRPRSWPRGRCCGATRCGWRGDEGAARSRGAAWCGSRRARRWASWAWPPSARCSSTCCCCRTAWSTSMRDMLERTGFDIRVHRHGRPAARRPTASPTPSAVLAAFAELPEVERALAIRFADAGAGAAARRRPAARGRRQPDRARRSRRVAGDGPQPWTVLRGPRRRPALEEVVVSQALADRPGRADRRSPAGARALPIARRDPAARAAAGGRRRGVSARAARPARARRLDGDAGRGVRRQLRATRPTPSWSRAAGDVDATAAASAPGAAATCGR